MPGCGMHSRPKLAETASYNSLLKIKSTTTATTTGGRLLILANLKTPAAYFDPPIINFSNIRVSSNLSRSFFRGCECSYSIKIQFFVLSYVMLFLDDASTS